MRRLTFSRFAAAGLSLVLTAGWSAGGRADPIDLFKTPTAAQRSGADVSAAAEPTEKRTAFVALNVAALGAKPSDARELRIKLFPGAVATFRRDGVETTDNGGEVWSGSAGGTDRATLLFDARGGLTGHIAIGNQIFGVERSGADLLKVYEVALDRVARFGLEMRPPSKGALRLDAQPTASEKSAAADVGGERVITALFVYSKRARKKSPDITLELELATAQANEAFGLAGIRIKPVGMVEVDGFHEKDSTWEQTLDAVSKSVGPFKHIGKLRNEKKADIVVMIRQPIDGDAYCGIAWYVEQPNYTTSKLGYSVVGRGGCLRIHALPHEIGHNLGLHHDRYMLEPMPPTDYNFGYVNLRKRVEDIMAYQNACNAKGFMCQRWNGFSDPTEIVKKQRFGVSAGNPDAADAVRRLRETGRCVADYR